MFNNKKIENLEIRIKNITSDVKNLHDKLYGDYVSGKLEKLDEQLEEVKENTYGFDAVHRSNEMDIKRRIKLLEDYFNLELSCESYRYIIKKKGKV